MKKGLFVTFEGPDGSGKTSISTRVCEELTSLGYSVMYSREPGGSEIAEKIRNIILDPNNSQMDDRTEALLYAASRRQNLVDTIKPSLERGEIVICDRFIDSSLAYQGYGRGLGADEVFRINQFAIQEMMPEKTYFVEVDFQTGLDRISKNRTNQDRLELAGSEFHKRVFDGYQKIYQKYSDRMTKIDGTKPIEENVAWILNDIVKQVKHDME